MVSRFVGRDYATLREEIISFLRNKLPRDWDWTNLSDPIVIFAESLARMGDQLHYTIDELRRECDVATAKRASSIYSYAMREGYKMMLPRASFGTLLINSKAQGNKLQLKIDKFSPIPVTNTGDTLYAAEKVEHTIYAPLDKEYAAALRAEATGDPTKSENLHGWYNYTNYVDTAAKRITRVPVVLGTLETFNFSYSDINSDSTIDIPDALIDRNLLSLVKHSSKSGDIELEYVDDIIGSGFSETSFTITPKFIGGAISLVIEFPSNYQELFDVQDTFSFRYIRTIDKKIDDTPENAAAINISDYIKPLPEYASDPSILSGISYELSLSDGIKGYTEYENPNVTRENYKKFVQSYASLLTKDDYASYIKAATSQHCQVFDHADNYRFDKVPEGTELIPRTIYIITDADYDGRRELWEDLKERSSRSDCIVLIPYGKDPYTIVVKAECYLLGTSVSAVATQIKKDLLEYYTADPGEKIPEVSKINYIVHKASDKVIRMDSCIVRDSTYGTVDNTFNRVFELENEDLDDIYYCVSHGKEYNNTKTGISTTATKDDETWIKYEPVKYNAFPDKFTNIYVISPAGESEVQTYEDLLGHQAAYGDLDSESWDYKDTDIFKGYRDTDDGTNQYRTIDKDYITHHYMVPVLNNIVVMVKAVTR